MNFRFDGKDFRKSSPMSDIVGLITYFIPSVLLREV